MTHDLQYEKLQKDCEMFLLANVKFSASELNPFRI